MSDTVCFIVLKCIKYKESGYIINGYSQLNGMESYILKTAQHKRRSSGLSYIYPLSIIEITPSQKIYGSMKSIKELYPHINTTKIRSNLVRSSIAFYISELVLKTIKEPGNDNTLFQFLYDQIVDLDSLPNISPDFRLYFTLDLIKYLGYQITDDLSNYLDYFDIASCKFVNTTNESGLILDKESSNILRNLLTCKNRYNQNITQNRFQRYCFINNMIKFISYHSQESINIESNEVLHQVFE